MISQTIYKYLYFNKLIKVKTTGIVDFFQVCLQNEYEPVRIYKCNRFKPWFNINSK
jgi:hypothetical protein